MTRHRFYGSIVSLVALSGCAQAPNVLEAPRGPATGAALRACNELPPALDLANTTFSSATSIPAGELTVAGTPVPAHCRLTGQMNPRLGIDGQRYAVSFEMRLPVQWNGRFFYQANGGLDGVVVPATGPVNGGAATTHALAMGFAVLSSDGGHTASMGAGFGADPQARLDYGYRAATALTPVAKSVIRKAYGKGPDRSYFGGCSNGGRSAMVAASRQPEQYDGYLVGDPGFNLPLAAIANIAGAQAYATLATSPTELASAFTLPERQLVSNAVLAKCDALDGVADGMIQDTAACQVAFQLERDVPACASARDGTCLSTQQKAVIARLFAGATDRSGKVFYATWPYDAGLATAGYASWKFVSPAQRDAPAVAQIFEVPPLKPADFDGIRFAMTSDIDALLAGARSTDGIYSDSGMSFMTPPHPTDLTALKQRGAKMLVYHGTSDPIFSSDDTTRWYEALRATNGGDASDFVRFFRVPGMNHCSGGPSTDQFDMLTPLVDWVENGHAPTQVIASARGAANPAAPNADVPATWSATRTRPLCPYPAVARYNGSGNIESASSFACR